MAVSQYFHRVSYRTARSRIEPNRSIWDRTKPNRSPPTSLPPPTSHLPAARDTAPRSAVTNLTTHHLPPPPPNRWGVGGGRRWRWRWEEGGAGGGRRWEVQRGGGGGWEAGGSTVPTGTSPKETEYNANRFRTEP